ncbi:hypothetical protein BpHYR1_022091 [Brachionus plicatilis]|uniref:Uncharacterized protein n=1 Tax=Brachionus plicatilis TaxID=10195 RepID=A0A3M7SVG6_BRAPC|nr:hypothetical protein BpHYR1_022091 [Brachionus plicatilis]
MIYIILTFFFLVRNKERCFGPLSWIKAFLHTLYLTAKFVSPLNEIPAQIFSFSSYFEVIGTLAGYLSGYLDGRLAYRRRENEFFQNGDFKTLIYEKLRKIPKQLCLSKPRENFFTNREASLWNELPDTVVSAKSTNAFKDKFDKFSSQQLVANYTTITRFKF